MISEERLKALIDAATLPDGDVLAWGLCYAVEREARREALEEAARVCDAMAGKWDVDGQPDPLAANCAAAIRALTGK